MAQKNEYFFEKASCGFLLLMIFLALFNQGLLYERQVLPVLMGVSLVSFIVILKKSLDRSPKDGKEYLPALGLFLFCLAAAVSLIGAADKHSALVTLCKYAALFLLMLAMLEFRHHLELKKWLICAFLISAVAMALLGLDAFWGNHLINAVNRFFNGGELPPEGSGFFFSMIVDQRLSAAFQYPNTTAIYLFGGWLCALHQILFVETGKRYWRRLYFSAAFLCFLAFFLTLSRGGFLVAFALLLLWFFLLPGGKRFPAVTAALITIIPAALLGLFAVPSAPLRNISPGLFWLIALGVAGLSAWAGEKALFSLRGKPAEGQVKAKSGKKRPALIIAAAIVIVAMGFSSLLWFGNAPSVLDQGSEQLVRLFSLEQGKYLLQVDFSEPIGEGVNDSQILVQSQNRQEIILNQYPEALKVSLKDFVSESRLSLPFSLGANCSQRLLVDGRAATDELTITSIRILDNEGKMVKEIRLSRPLLSEGIIQALERMLYLRTAYMRFSFYFDALDILKDYPLTGIGGGNWEYVYPQYQKYYYVSNDAHSFGLQMIAEHGLWGIAALAGIGILLLKALLIAWKEKKAEQITLVLVALAVFGHSLIDVDLAFYGYLLIFVLVLSALDYRGEEKNSWDIKNSAGIKTSTDRKASAGKKGLADEKPSSEVKRRKKSVTIFTAGCLLFALPFTLWLPWRIYGGALNAERYAYAARQEKSTAALYYIQKAAEQDPWKSEYKASLAFQLVSDGKVTQDAYNRSLILADQAFALGSHNQNTLRILSDYYYRTAQFEKADEISRQMVKNKPMYSSAWLERVKLIDTILLNFTKEDQTAERRSWLEKGLAVSTEMEEAALGKWTPVPANNQIQEYLDQWQQQLDELNNR
ncbi:MAG: O-antigen ligase family protein [Peptococcaceae bacterium]|nr:O-antigen ligase family protein [Peptococcaceae bacterium]